MGSRERKRAERQKRKARSASRRSDAPAHEQPIATSAAAAGVDAEDGESAIERGYAKSEERNRAAREALEPLHEGERPLVVTLGSLFSVVIGLIFLVSTGIALFTDTEVDGTKPNPLPLILIAIVVSAMAWGMWKARYWAVLGFQTVLLIFILAAVGGLVTAQTVVQVIGTLLLLAVAGTFFFFMIKALARIQMPHRLPRD